MDEIKALRDQMVKMKSSLDNYAIINTRLMHTVIKERSKGLNRLVTGEIILIPFLCLFFFGLCLFFFGLCYVLDMSMWIAITMAVGCIVSAIFDFKTVRVPSKLIGQLSLRDFKAYLLRQKRQRAIQMAIELPLSVIWLAWFLLEYIGNEKLFGDIIVDNTTKFIAVGVVIIIAIVVVAVIYLSIQDTNNRMIWEIEAMEGKNPTPKSPDTQQ